MSNLRFKELRPREGRGSRARCILLTDGSRETVANRLTGLIQPFGKVRADRHQWMPRGFDAPDEARLGEAPMLLSEKHRDCLRAWWLAVRHPMANTPNWDIASTATIGDREGLVLVEAKAHTNEIKADGKIRAATSNVENHFRIDACCREASVALNEIMPGWALSAESHYQLCNRFAWAWKLACLNIPVVLVYLGFLQAAEMRDQGDPFQTSGDWDILVRSHSRNAVPPAAWERGCLVGGIPLCPLIRSVRIDL